MSAQSSTPVLELVNVRKSFGDELVLRDVSLVVPEHSVTVLVQLDEHAVSTELQLVIDRHDPRTRRCRRCDCDHLGDIPVELVIDEKPPERE